MVENVSIERNTVLLNALVVDCIGVKAVQMVQGFVANQIDLKYCSMD